MDMFSLIYVSSAVKPFSPTELADLLAICHHNNASLGITGLLLYKDGNVMQALEGDETAVLALHARIGRDPRHHGMLTLLQGPVNERQFPEWSMGFRDLRARDVGDAVGYSEFLNTPLTGQEFASDPSRCQRLLMTFKQSM